MWRWVAAVSSVCMAAAALFWLVFAPRFAVPLAPAALTPDRMLLAPPHAVHDKAGQEIAVTPTSCRDAVDSSQGTSHSHVEPTVVYQDADAYEVYSAALAQNAWSDGQLLVIQAETVTGPFFRDPAGCYEVWNASECSLLKPVFRAFRNVNSGKKVLQPRFATRSEYQVVPEAELSELIKASRTGSPTSMCVTWNAIEKKYSGATGFIRLSAVGFSPRRDLALVYMDHSCGSLCGAGTFYMFQKQNGKWVEKLVSECGWVA